MIARRLLLVLLVVICGCNALQTNDGNVQWNAYPSGIPLPALWVQVTELPTICAPHQQNLIVHACAVRDVVHNVCTIYSRDSLLQARADTVKHELKHCEGYQHSEPIAMPDVRFR